MGEWAASVLLLGALSTSGTLPFWANANQYGLYPDSNGIIALAGVERPFNLDKAFDWRLGASLGFRYDNPDRTVMQADKVMPDELYVSLR